MGDRVADNFGKERLSSSAPGTDGLPDSVMKSRGDWGAQPGWAA